MKALIGLFLISFGLVAGACLPISTITKPVDGLARTLS